MEFGDRATPGDRGLKSGHFRLDSFDDVNAMDGDERPKSRLSRISRIRVCIWDRAVTGVAGESAGWTFCIRQVV
jgi:hypothetical protein